ncbi:50S ribosomal protein L22 [Patescibacteria group bacterium]|nr:MAG: 50S ribosomal protein L22 [Patescibacteria group bacterium]
MATVTAQLRNFRQSPRKVRLVADVVRGKRVEEALTSLLFIPKRAGAPIAKLIKSAVANAKTQNLDSKELLIKEIRVDGGDILYRNRPASRGRALPVRKRTSHVKLVLETKLPESEARNPKTEGDKVSKAKKLKAAL